MKDLQEAADYFLKTCYNVGIDYENRQGAQYDGRGEVQWEDWWII